MWFSHNFQYKVLVTAFSIHLYFKGEIIDITYLSAACTKNNFTVYFWLWVILKWIDGITSSIAFWCYRIDKINEEKVIPNYQKEKTKTFLLNTKPGILFLFEIMMHTGVLSGKVGTQMYDWERLSLFSHSGFAIPTYLFIFFEKVVLISGTFFIFALRVRAFFHKTVRVCHVYCNFKIGFKCRITVIFGTLKDGSLLINTLASKICLSYRNMFQNGVDALSKIVDAFLSKSSKFHLVRIIR